MFCSRYRAWAVYHLHTQSGQDQCIHQFFDRLSVSETDIIQYAAYILSAFSSRSHTSSQIYSSVIRCAIFQSRIEIYFPRKSDTPDAVSLDGAAAKISVSARIQRGETPATVFFNPSSVNAATFAANPSTLAAVGTDTNGISYSVAA